jgi:hypothetical protein
MNKVMLTVNGELVASDLFVEHAGAWVIQSEFVDGHAYLVQSRAFSKEVRKLDQHLSFQVTTVVQEREWHFHPATCEVYVFLAGEWTLETLPLSEAVEGRRVPTIIHLITQESRVFWIPPATCHRLNGRGLGLVLKAPPITGVGISEGKTSCTQCIYAPDCRLRRQSMLSSPGDDAISTGFQKENFNVGTNSTNHV